MVKGTPQQPEKETTWLHQGLVSQAFSLSFTLADNMEVSGATLHQWPAAYRSDPQ
ncbi:16 kDa heat shock protein B [Klebsiella pneumoniae subsp. ozaenae]|uniref:16 kDa heat shock protein B n=1 Tax=Klebsiella pneumoniae subsp. ozaenae TaxID=574 RepID=A0A378AUE4_KLEPO|nr:16 kDa heat shock protein B [Klebsiella pneumoniae subsp. ozaenae]